MIKTLRRRDVAALWMASSLTACGNMQTDAAFSSSEKKTADAVMQVDDVGTPVKSDLPVSADSLARIEQTFSADVWAGKEVVVEVDDNQITTEVELRNVYESESRVFQQVEREMLVSDWNQGHSGTPVEKNFSQSDGTKLLDIALVIDTSGSMNSERASIAGKLDPILSAVNDADWQIGIVTTDPNGSDSGNDNSLGKFNNDPNATRGCLRRLITKAQYEADTDPNKANVKADFADAIQGAREGTGNEQGIRMAAQALKCQIHDNNTVRWVRPNAAVAVLIVSDEDNCSNGAGCNGEPWADNSYLKNAITNDLGRELGTQARVYGIFWDPAIANCNGGFNRGELYKQIVLDTMGTFGPICAVNGVIDYSPTLTAISTDVATILEKTFILDSKPDTSTVPTVDVSYTPENGDPVVTTVQCVSGQDVFPCEIADETLRFTSEDEAKLPPVGSTLVVRYTTGYKTMAKEFSVGQSIGKVEALSASVGGAPVPLPNYNVIADKVVFSDFPAESAKIILSYRKDQPLSRSFDVGANATHFNVVVDGDKTKNYTYDAKKGELVFNEDSVPRDNAEIEVVFDRLIEKQLRYQLPVMGSVQKDVKIRDIDSGSDVTATLEGGILTIDAGDHIEGRKLSVSYRNEQSHKTSVILPFVPDVSSMAIKSGDEICKLGEGARLEGRKVFIECDFSNEGSFTIAFRYKAKMQKVYEVDGIPGTSTGKWSVLVNGQSVEFDRDGSKVILKSDPPPGAEVKVAFEPGSKES